MRILLVQPDEEAGIGLQKFDRVEPLGLEMVAAALDDRHEVMLKDLRVERDVFASVLADFRPQVVGVSSVFTVGMLQTLSVAETARAACPDAFVTVGGHHPSLHPDDFRHPAVDAIVVGEGEVTMGELTDVLAAGGDPAEVAGLVLNLPQGQHFTGTRFLQNLGALPQPRRSLTRSLRSHYHLFFRHPIAAVETTRGCPYRCDFCAVWRFYQKQVRFKSPQKVVEELAEVEEPDILFTDDNFLAAIGRAGETARLIQAHGIRKNYFIQARSDSIVRHPETIAAWQGVGLNGVFIGFEKPDQEGLDELNKHNSVENNEKALEVLRRYGIEPFCSFIVDPGYGRDDFRALRSYIRRLKLGRPLFTVLTLRGTFIPIHAANRRYS